MNSHCIGLVQMNSGGDVRQNLKFAHEQIRKAAQQTISLLAFPEVFLYLGNSSQEKFKMAQTLEGEIVQSFQHHAACYGISVLIGSIYETVPDFPEHLYNTSILLDRAGEIRGIYRKIHLFDVDAPTLQSLESKYIKPGLNAVVVDHEIGKIGLSICYDLRFPGLYQHLRDKGAEVIFVPSAFFLQTGINHWFPLLQARAIENQVYIAAPAQWGRHPGDRLSFGNSVLIDPWGTIISCASERVETIVGKIDLDYLHKIRQRMPVVEHRRSKFYPS